MKVLFGAKNFKKKGPSYSSVSPLRTSVCWELHPEEGSLCRYAWNRHFFHIWSGVFLPVECLETCLLVFQYCFICVPDVALCPDCDYFCWRPSQVRCPTSVRVICLNKCVFLCLTTNYLNKWLDLILDKNTESDIIRNEWMDPELCLKHYTGIIHVMIESRLTVLPVQQQGGLKQICLSQLHAFNIESNFITLFLLESLECLTPDKQVLSVACVYIWQCV